MTGLKVRDGENTESSIDREVRRKSWKIQEGDHHEEMPREGMPDGRGESSKWCGG